MPEQERITFGPGGMISIEDEANAELLGQLKETPPLDPEALIKLGQFYQAYPTSVALGNHLSTLALATKVGPQAVQATMRTFDLAELQDNWEDITQGFEDEKEPHEARVAAGAAAEATSDISLIVRRPVVAGIGLLIETLSFRADPANEDSRVDRHFIIGVSPAPENIED